MHTSVFCPAALSFIFQVLPDPDPAKMGSRGVGCTLDVGVKVHVVDSRTPHIFFNSQEIALPPVSEVLTLLNTPPVDVYIESELPLGYGFGISGASSLATAVALNHHFSLQKSLMDLGRIAHIAEVTHKTGLGTVGTQLTGGFLVKTAPGIPVTFTRLPFVDLPLYCIIIKKIDTPSILTSPASLSLINEAGAHALSRIQHQIDKISLSQVLDISYQFALDSTLLTDSTMLSLIHTLRETGAHASMAMLGNVIISDTPPPERIKNDYLTCCISSMPIQDITTTYHESH